MLHMKALVQRVRRSQVVVGGEVVGGISDGLMVLIGVHHTDTRVDVEHLCQKLLSLRIFCDENGQMNRSVRDIDGALLVVSQFTLYANTRKGNRPSFVAAAKPELARELYEELVDLLKKSYIPERVAAGVFGAHMEVKLVNDGPVTVELSTDYKK